MSNPNTGNDDLECSIVYTVQILGRKWNIHILSELMMVGQMTFTDLKNRLIGVTDETITSRVLTDKLQILEEMKIVSRTEDLESNHVYYGLTESGQDFKYVFSILKAWGIRHGGVKQKLCKNYQCIHNSVRHIEFADCERCMNPE